MARWITQSRPAWSRAAVLARSPLAVAAAVLAVVVLVVMGPLLLGDGVLVHTDIWTSDLLNHNQPLRAFVGAELRRGRFPLWVPGLYNGLPLIPHGEAAAMNPLTWLLFGVLSPSAATSWSLALHTWLAGFGVVLLARRLGVGLAAGLVAGISFMLCGFMVEHAKHLNLHHASAWLPWLVLAAVWLVESPSWRSAVVLGAVGGLQLTEGHPQMAFVSLFMLIPLLGWRLLQPDVRARLREPRTLLRLLCAGTGAVALAGLLSGAYVWSTLELADISVRRLAAHIDPWVFANRITFDPANLVTLLWAHAFGDGSDASYDPRYGLFWESWLYVGAVAAIAAVLALAVGVRQAVAGRHALVRRWLLLCAMALLTYALMIGPRTPVYRWLFDVVPTMSWFRFPQRFALALELVVVLMGALGIGATLRLVGRRFGTPRAQMLGAALVAITALDMSFIMSRHFPAAPAQASAPPASVAELGRQAPEEPWRYYSILDAESHGVAFREAKGWSGDLSPYVDHRNLLQPDSNLLWGLEAINGQGSLLPHDVGYLLGSQSIVGSFFAPGSTRVLRSGDCQAGQRPDFTGPCRHQLRCSPRFATLLGAFNVRFLVSPAEVERCAGLELAAAVPAGHFTAWLYRNNHWLPRAYLVDQVVDVQEIAEVAERLKSDLYSPAHTVWRLAGPAPWERSGARGVRERHRRARPRTRRPAGAPTWRLPPLDALTQMRRSAPALTGPAAASPGQCAHETLRPGKTRVRCAVERAAYLVVSETRYPGQRVSLDGRQVTPFAAQGILIGLPVTPGEHEVVVEYRPAYRWLVWAAWLGWLVLTCLGVAALWRRLRAAPAAAPS